MDGRRSRRGRGRQLELIPELIFQIDADNAKELLNQYFDKVHESNRVTVSHGLFIDTVVLLVASIGFRKE